MEVIRVRREEPLRLPKQLDWRFRKNLDQQALDKVFRQVQSIMGDTHFLGTFNFFILQNGAMGLLPLRITNVHHRRPFGLIGDVAYVLPSLGASLMVHAATHARGCFTPVRTCIVEWVMNG